MTQTVKYQSRKSDRNTIHRATKCNIITKCKIASTCERMTQKVKYIVNTTVNNTLHYELQSVKYSQNVK